MIRVIRSLIRACHPEPTAAVTAGATALAIGAGHSLRSAAVLGAAVLAGQLSIGWGNDWIDAPRDRSVGRTDKPVASGALSPRTIAVAAWLAAAATVALSLWFGVFAAAFHVVAVAVGWLYNWPLKTTWASVLPYAVAFGLLPGFVVAALPHHPAPPWWLVAAGALLGAGAHFANTLPDLKLDARTGVRGLPQRLGAGASQAITIVLLLAAGAVLAVYQGSMVGWLVVGASGLVLGAAVAARARYGERLLFRAVLVVGLADVGLLLTAPL